MLKIFKLSLILAAVCLFSAGGLSFVYLFTQPLITLNAQRELETSLRSVLPEADIFKEVSGSKGKVFEGIKKQRSIGFAVSVSPQGYSGPIDMLVGIDRNHKISGVKILNQRETPGLGSNITKSYFLLQFIGKTSYAPFEPKKDVAAITGATISTRAVCTGIKEALNRIKD